MKCQYKQPKLKQHEMPVQATKGKTTVIRAPDQRLRNITEIQDPQNIQSKPAPKKSKPQEVR